MKWLKNWFKKKDSTSVEDKIAHPKSLFDKGMDFYEHGDFQAARDAFENNIAEYQTLIAVGHDDLRPDLAKSYRLLGNCLEDNQAALTAYETGITECKQLIAEGYTDLQPELTKAQMNCGVCFFKLGDFSKARPIYETSIVNYEKLIIAGHTDLQPFLVMAQRNLGSCLFRLEEFSTARKIYEACIINNEKLISEGGHNELRDLAEMQVSLANCFVQLKNFSAAQKIYESSITNYENLVTKGHNELLPNLAQTYLLLGICFSEIHDLSEACTAYGKGVAGYEKLVAEGHDELITQLVPAQTGLGECLAKLGKLPRACKVYGDCITNYKYLIDIGHDELRPDLAATRMNLAIYLGSNGELALARTIYETTLNEYENLINQGRVDLEPDLALTHMNLAICLDSNGELALARTIYETTLNEYKNLINQGRVDLEPDLAFTRMNLALCLIDLGELALARTSSETALNEYKSLINQGRVELRPDLARTRMNLASCFANLGELSLARTAYETSLNEYESLIAQGRVELRPNLAQTRMNLAVCLDDLGDYLSAIRAYEACLGEYEKLVADGRIDLLPDLALTRNNVGAYFANNNNLPSACRAYEKSLSEYETLVAKGRTDLQHDVARTHRNLANTFKALGNLANAEKHYHASLTLLQTLQLAGQIVPHTFNFMRDITNWYRHPQRPKGADKPRAFELARQSLDWLDTLLTRISDTAKNVHIEKNLASFHLATELALELNQPEQAYLILERSKSRVLVEQMLRERAEPSSHVDENLRTQYRELRERLRSLVNQLDISTPASVTGNEGSTRFFTPTTRSIERRPQQTEQLWQQQQAVEQELDKVRRAITEQDAAFGEAIQPRSLTVDEVIALIPADTLVIAFEQRPEFLYLYAITAQGIKTPLQIDLSLQQVNERVEAFKTEITKKTVKPKRKELTKISQWLETHLKQSVTELTAQFQPNQIILIPHIGWHLLPIHLVSINDEPLAVRYSVRYLPSLQILRLISERPPANQGKGCIIANPWSEALEKLIGKEHELKSGEKEGYKVYELRAQVDTLLAREQATSTEVRKALDKAQHSHFSCHGHFDADLTKAGLTLADCKDLAAIEMFTSIRLDNPRLVVMSACETAQIKPTLADEYMGLSSSFLFAGAHNVLATLWRVDDNASRLLIEDFYQGLNDGLSPVNALQKAQRHLREMTIEELYERLKVPIADDFENPYYWAGFILIGDGK
jgi:CHAT domain-containing protein